MVSLSVVLTDVEPEIGKDTGQSAVAAERAWADHPRHTIKNLTNQVLDRAPQRGHLNRTIGERFGVELDSCPLEQRVRGLHLGVHLPEMRELVRVG